jgi:hypothetical protein
VKKKGTQLSVHHTPFWGFYFLTRKGFLLKRKAAYQKVAEELQEGKSRFWKGIEHVVADSFWLNYSLEPGQVQKNKATRFKVGADLLLRSMNIRNWLYPNAIFRNVRKKELFFFTIKTSDFIQRYTRRG